MERAVFPLVTDSSNIFVRIGQIPRLPKDNVWVLGFFFIGFCCSANCFPGDRKQLEADKFSDSTSGWISLRRLVSSILKCRNYEEPTGDNHSEKLILLQSSSFRQNLTIDEPAVPSSRSNPLFSSDSFSSMNENEQITTKNYQTIVTCANGKSTLSAGCKVDLHDIKSSNYCNRDRVINDKSDAINVYRVAQTVV